MNTQHRHWPRIALLVLLGLLLLVSGRAVLADTVIHEGETRTADVNVTEDFRLEAGGVVHANVNVWGSDALVAGTIDGDLLVFGGDLELGASAQIGGDCVLLGGELKRNDSAITCQTITELDLPPFLNRLGELGALDGQTFPFDPDNLDEALPARGGSLFGALGSSIVLGLLALLVASVAPRPVARVSSAIASKPVASGTVGVLTMLASVSAMVLLALLSAVLIIVCIGLLGIPILVALATLLVVGLLVGWVAVGRIVGNTLAEALKLKTVSPAVQTALGTAALSLGIGLLQLLPLVGFTAGLLTFVVYAMGLGGVALTKFGTRSYPLQVAAPAPRADKLTSVLETLPPGERL